MIDPAAVQARLEGVRQRIAQAAGRAGRDPSSIRLVAVSKTFPIDAIRAAAAAGQRDFGENKVQELVAKIDAAGDLPVTWHLIGHLQTNKAKRAGASANWIHSVDSTEVLRRVDEGAASAGRRVDVLLQVDLAREPTKHGARPEELRALLKVAQTLSALRVRGLMLLPPLAEDPEGARPFFVQLRELRRSLLDEGVDPGLLAELSMGMSHDFEVAVEEGATLLRIGSAIFGPRPLL